MADPFQSTTFGNSLSLRVDGAIGAMSLSPNGRDAVLAGRKGLFIIDLDDPFTTPRWLHHITSWEVADVQWSPHAAKPSWCISTSNQKALLWDLARPSTKAIQNVLHRHTRAITDINFHPSDPELLATCSIDTFVFTWDMRTPRRPVNKYAEWRAGATQVKWNHSNPYQLASSHHHSFYLWDSRYGALPILKIENAHEGKINGLDFSGSNDRLLTCSNDKTIKVWDMHESNSNPLTEMCPSIVMNTDYPVARARNLPFGKDNCCGIMPVRGGDNAVHVVNYHAEFERAKSLGETLQVDAIPDYSFKGHNGPLKDFLWRTQHEKYDKFDSKRSWKEFQLVTWSPSDYDLKLWPHDDQLYDVANYNPLKEKLFESLVGGSSENPGSRSNSSTSISDSEIYQSEKGALPKYETYVMEPEMSLTDILKDQTGDLLSKISYYSIKSQKHQSNSSQLNHLSWISGVRMGHDSRRQNTEGDDVDESGPSNLGEEVSIVGHKFPKVRFEKISVSTGHIVVSMRGPLPSLPQDPGSIQGERKERDGTLPDANSSLINGSTQKSGQNSSPALKESEAFPNSTDAEADLVFIRLEIKFPKQYPYLDAIELNSKSKRQTKLKKINQIKFNIEETHEIGTAVRELMLDNLDEIASFFSNKYNRFCLEPCLRYLMGDKIGLDDSIMIKSENSNSDDNSNATDGAMQVGSENWVDDLVDQHEAAGTFLKEFSISGDEEDDEGDLISGINDKLNLSLELSNASQEANGTTSQENKIKHDSTPVPKGCGALWTNDGQLVCFFIPKSNEQESERVSQKFNILKFTENGFGLKYSETNHRKDHEDASDSDDSEDQDDKEPSSVSSHSSLSSNDSFSNDWDDMLQVDIPSRSQISGLFKGPVALGKRLKSNKSTMKRTISGRDSINRSITHDSASRSAKKDSKSEKSKSIVTVLDFKHLIPDKYELACEYRVLGDSPESIARHNAEVAFHHGFGEIGEVWKIVEMILVKDVKLRDLTEVGKDFFHQTNEYSGQYYWGGHPLGHAWMIGELFAHFERKRNLQMLAMLSCILFENIDNVKVRESSQLEVPIHTPYSALPPRPSVTAMRVKGLLHSPDLVDNESISHHETYDSSLRKPSTTSYREIRNARHSPGDQRAESPLRISSFRKSSINSSPFNDPFSESLSERPSKSFDSPRRHPRNSMQKSGKSIQTRSSQTLRNKRLPPSFIVSMKNEESLDLYENYYTSSLLSGIDPQRIFEYREQYADMLYTWGLPMHRIKILKFNYVGDSHKHDTSLVFEDHRCLFGVPEQDRSSEFQTLVPSTLINTAKENKWNSSERDAHQYCGFCGLIVSKRIVLCTECEHILHPHCATEWWSQEADATSGDCPTGCGCTCLLS